MKILVIRNQEEPTSPEDGIEIWNGGDGEDGLPGSLVTTLAPELEIATWYPFDIYAQAIAKQTADIHPAWTTVPLQFSGVNGDVEALIEVKQTDAALLMLEALVSHLKASGKTADLWVWIV